MKKSVILCSIIMSMGLLLTGCTNSFDHMPDLTEEESALISEYAAGILLKHDKNAGKLASEDEIAAADERAAILQANMDEYLASQGMGEGEETGEASENDENNGGTTDAIDAAQTAEVPFEGIAQFCGADGFRIDYLGHTVCDSYPEDDGSNMVFAMDATAGNKLLVLRFTVENTTAEDKELNMLDLDTRFRIGINDGSMESALSTLLLDDLSSYKDVIPSGNAIVLVLTREITEEEAASVQTISLSMRNESGSATTSLE